MILVPYIKYVEALVLSHKTIPEINQILESQNLDPVPLPYLQVIVQTLHQYQPQVLTGDFPDFDWLKEYELAPIWSYINKAPLSETSPEEMQCVEKAFEMLDDPILYKVVTAAALAKATEEQYLLILSSQVNSRYNIEDLKTFLKYFFKVDKWTNKNKLDWIETVSDQTLIPIYKLALKGDVEYLLWKLGIRTDAVDYSFMMADMSRDAYWYFKENAANDADSAQKWGNLAVKLVEKAKQHEKELSGHSSLDDIQFQIQAVIQGKLQTENVDPDATKHKQPFKAAFRKWEDLAKNEL